MTTQISPSDYEAISAYLDNELTARERAWLEQRLAREPILRQALAELRHTRAVLRSQPRLRAPRNFTLTPQMAGVTAGRRPARSAPAAFPVLRLASMLATFFFIIMTAGSFYLRAYAPAPRQVTAVAQDARPFGMGGGGGMVEPPAAPAGAAPALEATDAAPAAIASAAITDTTELAPASEAYPADPVAKAIPGAEGQNPEAPQALEVPNPAIDQPVQPAATPGLSTWRLGWIILTAVQVLLAFLALVTGAAAFWLRRSSRR
jgi:anti-sigma factor RsiW